MSFLERHHRVGSLLIKDHPFQNFQGKKGQSLLMSDKNKTKFSTLGTKANLV